MGRVRATEYEIAMGRDLARLGASSSDQSRPRVVALLELDPLVVAGGHGFTTDLIELAGGTHIAHENHEQTRVTDVAQLSASEPDLILVLSSTPLPEPVRAAARALLAEAAPLEFFELDPARFWVRDGVATVKRLHALIKRFAVASPPPGGGA